MKKINTVGGVQSLLREGAVLPDGNVLSVTASDVQVLLLRTAVLTPLEALALDW